MKNTPKVTTPGTNGALSANGAKIVIAPGVPVPVSKLIEEAKNGQPATDAKPYPTPAPKPETEKDPAPATSQAPEVKPAPTPEPVAAPVAAVIPPAPEKPALSVAEQLDYWNEKARKISLVNTQLLSLKAKAADLNDFGFNVDRSEDYHYASFRITDDAQKVFECKNHALLAMVVDFLKAKFSEKISEKEAELLAVAHE